jgi:Family of unknown function (DUF6011)
MSFPTSYVKLDDGSWGLRIPGPQNKPGDVVVVTTRSGQTKRETLGTLRGINKWGDTLWGIVQAAPAPQAAVGDLGGVLALFAKAKTHLKRPAILLSVPEADTSIRLTIAGERAKVPGSLTVTTGEYTTTNDYGEPARAWLGRVTVEGVYQPSREANGRTDAIVRRLGELARDPAKVAAEHGKLTGRCCFCNRALSDERSTAVGYGQTCADHYGVAWGSKPASFGEGA